MNIDWSKAPEDATHYSPGGDVYSASWIKWVNGELHGWLKSNDTSWGRLPFQEKDLDQISLHVDRPKKQEAWDGEGLPPEKCDCEVLWSSDTGEYVTATVLAHDQGGAIVRYTSGKNKGCISEQIVGCFNFKGCQIPNFRPIKTAEQLAEEEREKAIADMMEVTSDGISCIGQDDALALYKAGYRKQ